MRLVSFLQLSVYIKLKVSPWHHIDDGLASSLVVEVPFDGIAV